MKTHFIEPYDQSAPAAYVSNGLIGLTVPLTPFESGEARVSGCYEMSEEYGSERIATVPFPLGLSCSLNGIPLTRHAEAFVRQAYDFSCGELRTELDYRVNEITINVSSTVFCSRTRPTITIQKTVFTASLECTLVIDLRAATGSARGSACNPGIRQDGIDWVFRWSTGGELSSAGIALTSECSSGELPRPHPADPMTSRYQLRAKAGNSVTLTQYASLVPELLHPEPHLQALRMVRAARWMGCEELEARNRAAWNELWRGRILLTGAGETWQDLADSAYFYLMSSVHPSTPCSIPPFGLSSSGYNGHVFWDTETFMFPVVLLSDPASARALVRYRLDRVESARNNAALNGYSGAMYPWESGASGAEVTPVFAATSEEHHVTPDIGFALLQYIHNADDTAFCRTQVWPALAEICRWIESRVTETGRGFEIRNVVGVDEGIDNINNNSYTNIAAKIVLEEAGAYAREAGLDVDTTAWDEIASRLVIPIDEEKQIILKHETYEYLDGPCVPETLAAFFPLTYRHPDKEVENNTYDYHLDLADTVIHFPMLSSLFGVWAARRGNRELSSTCFHKGIMEFICKPYLSFSEFRGADRPNFLTNPAGFLTACLYGLTGIQMGADAPENWAKYPIVLPRGWEAIEVERIWIRGRPASIVARQGAERAEIIWLEEDQR